MKWHSAQVLKKAKREDILNSKLHVGEGHFEFVHSHIIRDVQSPRHLVAFYLLIRLYGSHYLQPTAEYGCRKYLPWKWH